jgi:hypothetical protein
VNAPVEVHVAGLLKRADTPVEIKNALGHAMDEIYNKLPSDQTCNAYWYVHHVLLAYQRQQEREAGKE